MRPVRQLNVGDMYNMYQMVMNFELNIRDLWLVSVVGSGSTRPSTAQLWK